VAKTRKELSVFRNKNSIINAFILRTVFGTMLLPWLYKGVTYAYVGRCCPTWPRATRLSVRTGAFDVV
jgi:hypothetical protein